MQRIGVRQGKASKRSKKHSELPGLMWTNGLWMRNYHQQTLALGFQEPTGQKSKHSLQAKTRSGCRGLKSLWKINQQICHAENWFAWKNRCRHCLILILDSRESPELKLAHKDHRVQLLALHKRPQESQHVMLCKRARCWHTIFNAIVGTAPQILVHLHIW